MTLSDTEIAAATQTCATFQPFYHGPNPLSAGGGTDDALERAAEIEAAWTAWSGFARNYFMAMLNTIGGCKPMALTSEIARFCTPAEALGGRAAMDVFWRRGLSINGPVTRYGGMAMTKIQHAIIADETVNAKVFTAVEQKMEADILHVLRSRRGFLQQIEAEVDHRAMVQGDIDFIFGAGRPQRLSAKERNENFDNSLF